MKLYCTQRAVIFLLFIAFFGNGFSQLSESFDNVPGLTGSGWVIKNNSSPVGGNNWFQGNPTVFVANSGATNAYVGANFNSTACSFFDLITGDISNWLMTPVITFHNGDQVSFYTRKASPDLYPDRLQLRMSINGASTNVGNGINTVGDFSNLLLSVNPTLVTGVYPTTWTQYTYTITGLAAPVTGRLAFRYFVPDSGPCADYSDYIGIDDFVYTLMTTACPQPTSVTATPTAICVGSSANLVANYASATQSASWFTQATGGTSIGTSLSGANFAVSPTVTTDYYAETVPVSGCTPGTRTKVTVTVNSLPTAGVTASLPSICAGQTSVLTATGGNTYTWSPATGLSATTGTSVNALPTTTQTYTVTATDGNGCIDTETITINVNSLAVSVVSDVASICPGESATLTASGATSYTWTPATGLSAVTGNEVTAEPTSTQTYTVTGTSSGCQGSQNITITVKTNPTVSVNPSTANLCLGNSTSLTASGAVSYIWLPVVISGTTISVSPVTTTNYTVFGTAANGCVGQGTATVNVTTPPTASISYGGTPFCNSLSTAQAVTQTGTTGGTYSAAAGLTINASTGAITPSTSTPGTYTVNYTIAASGGCAALTVSTSVTIQALPAATITYAGSPFCGDLSAAQAVTQIGTTGGTYTSTSGLSLNASTGAIVPATSTAGTYTVTYTIAASGACPAVSATASVTITAPPVASIAYPGSPFCGNVSAVQAVSQTGNTGGTYSSTAGLSINASTGGISPSASTAGTYTVNYIIAASGGCAALTANTSVTITALPVATISYAGSPFCRNVSVAQNVTQTGTSGGTYSSTTGLSIDATTGAITPSASTPGTYTVTYAIAASGGCPAVTATASVTITAPPVASIAYASAPFCTSVSAGQSVTQTGTTGGTYSSTAGLIINASTGAVTPSTSTPGTYTITYTIAASGGCPAYTTTASVTVNALPVATIAYAGSPFCRNVSVAQNVTQTGTSGGTYSSTTGLSIDATTGAITPSASTPGTYTVTYAIAASGGCPAVTATASVTITTPPVASIAYASAPFCTSVSAGQSVTQTGTTGGTYSSTAGLSLNASTGAVTPSTSTPGTYTITYTIAASGGCPAYTTTASVTVNALPAATIAYAGSPFCGNVSVAQNVTQTGTSGGTYSSTPGLTIDATSGAITPSTSTAGTYTVTYTIAASGNCPAVTATTSVTITTPGSATIAYAGSPFCMNISGAQSVTRTGTAGGTYSSTAGLSLNASTGAITPATSTAGTYTVTYTLAAAGGCPAITATATVTIHAVPTATIAYPGSPFCNNVSVAQTVNQTGTTGGTYTSTTGLSIDASTGAITPSTSTAGTYTVTYTIAASGGCPAVTATASVTITTAPSATIAYSGSPFCIGATGTQAVTRTGASGGTYSSTAGLTINASTGAITPSTSTAGTYTVTYTVAASGGCPPLVVTTTVTVYSVPTASIAYAGSPFCGNVSAAQAVSQTGTLGGTFSSTTGLSLNASTGAITPATSTAGTYTVTYTIAASGGCPAVSATASVTITTPASATISYAGSPFCISATGAQAVTRTGTSGGTYSSTAGLSINTSTGAITPSTSTAGTYTVTYTIAASGGCPAVTATTTVTINQLPTASIAYTGSPFCGNLPSQTVNQTGASGGVYSSTTGLSLNASTGAITPATSTAGTYTITYTIAASGGCPAVTATAVVTITAVPSASISYAGTPFCKSLTSAQAVTITGTTGGTFASTAGLTLNATTGAIVPSTSTAGTYTVTYSLAATGGCPAATATTTVIITTQPNATISYAGSPFCASVSGGQAVTFTGTTGGTYSSTAGLNLNATTGSVDPSLSTAGTYTVHYIIGASGGCAQLDATAQVVINAVPSASIAYGSAQFCSSISTAQPVSLTGTTGGVYSSTTGLSINATTGAIIPSTSTPGTYTVTYQVNPAGCSMISATAVVEIVLSPVASISYAGPYCASVAAVQAVNLNGTGNYLGGSYTASPVGLGINPATGGITPNASTAGTYLVTYTVPASLGCSSGTATANVTITATPSAVISYASPLCSNLSGVQAVNFTGTAGGSFSSTSGLAINTSTGGITPTASTPGTYVVTYLTPVVSGCPPGTATSTVQIIAAPNITDLADQVICGSNYTLPAITGTSLTGSQMYYTGPGGTGAAYAAGAVLTSTTQLYMRDVNNGCADEEMVLITINQLPVITNPGNQTVCGSYVLPAIAGTNLSGAQGYYNNSHALGGTLLSGSITTTQTVWIYDANGTCSDEESFVVTINPIPSTAFSASDYCGPVGVFPILTGVFGGTFSFNPAVADGATIDPNTGYISNGVEGTTYTVEYSISGLCPSASQDEVTINPIPSSPVAGKDTTYCSSETFAGMTATANAGGTLNWYDNVALSNQVGTGNTLVPANVVGTTTYYVTETMNGCKGNPAQVTITVNESPATPQAGDNATYCLGDSLADLHASALPGNLFSWYLNAGLTNLYGVGNTIAPKNEQGTTTYYVTQTLASGCASAAATVVVTINDCFEIEIPTAFTPADGDNVNNTWEIAGLNTKYPNNQVSIFNRWGQVLFKSDGYATPWDGQYNGEDMPVGSYYYIIEFNDAGKTPKRTGTVSIIRN